jgi:uncharacterized protein with PIN domain
MRLFADTNWLVASYFNILDDDRSAIVGRFARKHDRPLMVAPMVYLEARNAFSWIARSSNPKEWQLLQADLGSKLVLLPIDWAAISTKAEDMFTRYSHRAKLGAFDVILVASALLSEATHFLSFDTNSNARSLAATVKLKVFPELVSADKQRLADLR